MKTVRKIIGRCLALSVAGILILLVSSCSSFNREWKKAAKVPTAPSSMEGRWEGHWVSDVNGHKGKLRCLISRKGEGEYAARFKATYLKVLKFSYTVPLKVEHTNDGWQFHGEENLGILAGGVYQYDGTATRTNFHSSYHSKYDHGVFEMARPETSGQ